MENLENSEERKYTQRELDEAVKEKLDKILPGKLARKEARIRKELNRETGELMDMLRTATGKESVEDITGYLRDAFGDRGLEIKKTPEYSRQDLEILASKDAEDIISGDYEDVVEELEWMGKQGDDKLTARERATKAELEKYRSSQERARQLEQANIPEEVFNSEKFKEFSKDFSESAPLSKVYEFYQMANPQKEIETMGSIRSDTPDTGAKDFYSVEEARALPDGALNDPAVYAAVLRSMEKW